MAPDWEKSQISPWWHCNSIAFWVRTAILYYWRHRSYCLLITFYIILYFISLPLFQPVSRPLPLCCFHWQKPCGGFNIIEAVVRALICDLGLSLSIRGDTLSLSISSLRPSLPFTPRLWIPLCLRLLHKYSACRPVIYTHNLPLPIISTPGHMDVDIPLCPNLLSCPLFLFSRSPPWLLSSF